MNLKVAIRLGLWVGHRVEPLNKYEGRC
jgi:hypothetical protein